MLRSRKGFTLIELLIVVFIIAILAAMVIPAGVAVFSGGGDTPSQVEVMSQEQELQQMKQEKAPEQEVKSIDKGQETKL